jgi:hypothetical protein
MGRFESTNILWPPSGWSQFASVQASAGQAVAKDISKARIYGLQYRIDSVPLFKNETKLFRHDIQIDGWEYSILNESIEYPVLSFSLMDRFDLTIPRESFVTNIRSYSSSIPATRRSATRAVSGALFFIRQITSAQVPDVNRALRIYKLHPTQAFLYKDDQKPEYNLKNAFRNERSTSSNGRI